MDRKQYWNESYVRYWRARTAEAGGEAPRGDCVPADVVLFEGYVDRLGLEPGDDVLEVGVGFGRLIPSLLKRGASVYGIDISPQMIDVARDQLGNDVKELRESEAEAIVYPDARFDHVVCWGVFDACYQEQALVEMARVLKPGGRLLLSGKNDNYADDDEMAFVAEVNARAKGHPNFFTDVPLLLSAASTIGLHVEETFFFARRGDMGANRFTRVAPPQFYEYAIVCVKQKPVRAVRPVNLAKSYSRTCARRDPLVAARAEP